MLVNCLHIGEKQRTHSVKKKKKKERKPGGGGARL